MSENSMGGKVISKPGAAIEVRVVEIPPRIQEKISAALKESEVVDQCLQDMAHVGIKALVVVWAITTMVALTAVAADAGAGIGMSVTAISAIYPFVWMRRELNKIRDLLP